MPVFNSLIHYLTERLHNVKINQKRFELHNNELQFGLFTEQNNMQVQNAKMQKEVAKKTVETTTEQIQLAQTIYEQTILQQKLGTASLTDVLLADNALREAQQTYLNAVIDYLKADLELKNSQEIFQQPNNYYNEYKNFNFKKGIIHYHTIDIDCHHSNQVEKQQRNYTK